MSIIMCAQLIINDSELESGKIGSVLLYNNGWNLKFRDETNYDIKKLFKQKFL